MNHSDVVDQVAEKAEIPKVDAARIIKVIAGVIEENLKNEGDSVRFSELGTFKVINRIERKGRNPRTGEEITIPAKQAVMFKVSKNLNRHVQ